MSLTLTALLYLRFFSHVDGTSTLERRRQFDNSIVKTTKQNLWSVDDEGMISYRKRVYAILKNRSKSGNFFWLQVSFDFKVNEDTREIENIYAYYTKASKTATNELAQSAPLVVST